jgi:membrane protease YdiL (CAAX protease family)
MGWRGFLVPELAKFISFTSVALTSGLIWAVWHWPMIFMGIYGPEGTPLVYQLFFFSTLMIALSMIMTYLRFKTNSLWTAVIFHMSFNIFMQKAFGPFTVMNENSVWFVDEFGAIPAVVASVVAVYFWKKGKKEFHSQPKVGSA